MNITTFSIIIIIFALFALSRSVLRFLDKTIGAPQLITWMAIWSGLIFFALYPVKSEVVARFLGVGKGTDALFAIAIVFLFYSVFRLYAKLDKKDKQIALLVRKIAIRDAKRKLG